MTIRRERHLDITINVAVHPSAATDTGTYDAIIGKLHGELDQLAGSILAGRMDHRLSLNTGDSNPYRAREEHLRGAAFIDPYCFLIRLMARPVMMQRRPSCGRRNATEGPRLPTAPSTCRRRECGMFRRDRRTRPPAAEDDAGYRDG